MAERTRFVFNVSNMNMKIDTAAYERQCEKYIVAK